MSSQEWHSGAKLRTAVNKFHDKHARQPRDNIMKPAKEKLHALLDVIEAQLREQNICVRREPTGSSYQGTKIDDGYLEFDVLFEIDCRGVKPKPLPDCLSHCILEIPPHPPNQRDRLHNIFKSSIVKEEIEYISPITFSSKFLGYIAKLESKGLLGSDVKLSEHGQPAVQMNVSRNGQFWFAVDLVPVCRISDELQFVAKPYKTLGNEVEWSDRSWCFCFSLKEKQHFLDMDQGSLCRKPAMRVLKASLKRKTDLALLTSYHVKTILLHNIANNPYNKDARWWPQDDVLAARVIELLTDLHKAIKSGVLYHFYIPGDNLFKKIPQKTMNQMRYRLERLLNKEKQMLKFFDAVSTEGYYEADSDDSDDDYGDSDEDSDDSDDDYDDSYRGACSALEGASRTNTRQKEAEQGSFNWGMFGKAFAGVTVGVVGAAVGAAVVYDALKDEQNDSANDRNKEKNRKRN